MEATRALAEEVGIRSACSALGVSRATFYRRLPKQKAPAVPTQEAPPARSRPEPPLKLSQDEVDEVVEALNCPRFVDRSPRQIWATLLDEDKRYLCSVRTMYRILDQRGEVKERRNSAPSPQIREARAARHRAQRGLELGHHQAQGADQRILVLPLRDSGHLQSLRRRLALGSTRRGRSGRRADPGFARKAGNRSRSVGDSRGSRAQHDLENGGIADVRARRGQVPQPSVHEQRQPVFRGSIQDPQIPFELS